MKTKMKSAKTLAVLVAVAIVALFTACDKDGDNDGYSPNNWGKPHTVIEYQDATGRIVWETTTYYYDHLGRLTGYRSVNWSGYPNEEMLNSKFAGNTHTYDLHSYEWLGVRLPVVFHYTDTYTDATFSTIATRQFKAKNMDIQETITYRYENGRQTGYHTIVEGQYPDEFDTQILYRTETYPSARIFPHQVEDKDNHIEIIYLNREGNRTGYYNDNDYSRAQWNFNYYNGYCTYYTSQFGDIDMPHLVHVVFYPDNK